MVWRVVLAIGICFSIFSQAEDDVEISDTENGAEWLENYYLNPTAEQFVPRMKVWAANGTLRSDQARPALTGFVSQLFRQNRSKIADWVKELRVGEPEDFVVLDNALYYSRTSQADRIIEASLGRELEDKDRPSKILERPLNEPPAMNMVWGYFYATGSENAIRRIIEGFRYVGAPVAPEGEDVPEGYEPYYVKLPELAASSLNKNMASHPRVLEICEKIYKKDSSLTKNEKINLYHLLSLHLPDRYPPDNPEQ